MSMFEKAYQDCPIGGTKFISAQDDQGGHDGFAGEAAKAEQANREGKIEITYRHPNDEIAGRPIDAIKFTRLH